MSVSSSAAGEDYDMVNDPSQYFPIGSTNGSPQICTEVSLLDNQAFEKNEYFFVLVSSEPNVQVHNNLTAHIEDDDSKMLASRFTLS